MTPSDLKAKRHAPATTPDSLRSWRKRLYFSQTDAAQALGLSLRGYQNYESGERRIPKAVGLACAAVAKGLKPITD